MLIELPLFSFFFVFFFSSRRRHTRYWRDWSSDVCSSDLNGNLFLPKKQRIFSAKETKNPKTDFSWATILAGRPLTIYIFFESFPKETQKRRILRIRIQIIPLYPRCERIHWIHNHFLVLPKKRKIDPFWIQNPD